MKELSIEEKAKAYDEAIERAKQLSKELTVDDIVEQIFPELAESKDEKVRKALIHYMKDYSDGTGLIHATYGVSRNDAIAWLEKQGEQKTTDKVEPKFKVGDIIRLKDGDGLEWTVEKVFNNGYYTIVCADRDDFLLLDDNWELVEQKLWNEEDEERYESCLQKLGTGNPEQPETINSKWFKEHVYPQSTWKPSGMQMTALRRVKNAVGGEGEIYEPLNSLYEDLKKLKE